ncbi:MAG: phosphotransferase [Oscillospiraceae bacterium]|nr:phosphotransferase [Oscillospiraceae bacterium]
MELVSMLIRDHYGMEVKEARKMTIGAGSNTWMLRTERGQYILKNANINEANNPQNEPAFCEHLRQKGLPVSEFVRDLQGQFVWTHCGEVYHLQKFIEGNCPAWHSAPPWLLRESAQLLGRIHTALEDYTALPVGIGEGFFLHMTPQTALRSYRNTLRLAKRAGDKAIADDLNYRIELMKRLAIPPIEIRRLTCRNTHGDYFISNLICGESNINAVIDWTTACVHPVVWEILRSYVYAAPECGEGKINIVACVDYVREYQQFAALTTNDLQMMPWLFFYQIAVCDYYNQYYQSQAANREIYLKQAVLSTRLMQWFERNAEELSRTLCSLK